MFIFPLVYIPRKAINGQALANFPIEMQDDGKPTMDEVHPTYYGTNPIQLLAYVCRSGAGILLISPHANELLYVLRFSFMTTKNKVEYKAPISGLEIPKTI